MKKLLIGVVVLTLVLSAGYAVAASTNTTPQCYTFNKDLFYSNSNNTNSISFPRSESDNNANARIKEIKNLQQILTSKESATITDKAGAFRLDTAAAVVAFQTKYGLIKTGVVTQDTRTKLNQLYGCIDESKITLTSQNKDSSVAQGSVLKVSWKATKIPAQATLYIGLFTPSSGTLAVQASTTIQSGDGTYNLNLPATLPLGQYKVEVAISGGGAVDSKGIVNVVSSSQGISILSPANGATFNTGNDISFSWITSGLINKTSILLVSASGATTTVKNDISISTNTASLSWNIPRNLPTGIYKVIVKSENVSTSTSITINSVRENNTQTSISADFPSRMKIGSNQEVFVRGLNNLQNVPTGSQTIIVLDSLYRLSSSAYSSTSNQKITFTVGTSLPGLSAITPLQLAVGQHSVGAIVMAPDTSGSLGGHGAIVASSSVSNVNILAATVVDNAVGSITNVGPSTGSIYTVGATLPITWTANSKVSGVKVELYKNQTLSQTIDSSVSASRGSLNYTLPLTLSVGPSYSYFVKVSDRSNPSIYATSTVFGISRQSITGLNIAPSDVNVGGQVNIRWTNPDGIRGFDVSLVPTTGGSPSVLRSNTSDIQYIWNIPSAQAVGSYVFVVSNHSDISNTATSSVFAVTPKVSTTPPSKPGTPKVSTGATCGGQISMTWNVVANAAGYNIYRATSSSGVYVKVQSNIANPSYSELAGQGKFYYKVSAVNSVGAESVLSSQDSATASRVCAVSEVNSHSLTANAFDAIGNAVGQFSQSFQAIFGR